MKCNFWSNKIFFFFCKIYSFCSSKPLFLQPWRDCATESLLLIPWRPETVLWTKNVWFPPFLEAGLSRKMSVCAHTSYPMSSLTSERKPHCNPEFFTRMKYEKLIWVTAPARTTSAIKSLALFSDHRWTQSSFFSIYSTTVESSKIAMSYFIL